MRRARLGLFALILFAGAAFAVANLQALGLRLLNIAPAFSRTEIVRDKVYGLKPWQRLDLYMSAGKAAGARPAVVFFYGGRWTTGIKESYRFVGDAFARRGYIAVIPDYAKYPAARFPVFVEDGAKALAWVFDQIAEYGGNPDRIFVAGHSAGAHIGALLATDPAYLASEGKDRSAVIRGFAGLAGPYAFTPDEPDLMDIFGPPERYPEMQAPTFIDGKEPPMLLLYGDADRAVGRFNLDRLEARIREKGGTVKAVIYPGVGHLWIVGALSWVNFRGPPVLDDMLAFFAAIDHKP